MSLRSASATPGGESAAARRSQVRFVALDGWRGISALMISLFHLFAFDHYSEMGFVRNSHLLVEFFFVLSGFVVCHAYRDRIDDLRSALGFAVRRFGRVYPLHAFMLLAFVLLHVIVSTIDPAVPVFDAVDTPKSIVTNLLLLHSLGVHNRLTWDGPSWTISVEFVTYLTFAALVLLARRRVAPVFALFALLGGAVVVVCSKSYMDTTYDYGLFRCFYSFFTGACLHALTQRMPDWQPSAAIATVMELLGLAAVWLLMSASPSWTFVAPLPLAYFVFVFSRQAGLLSALLTTAPMRRIGDWSYSIYLMHVFVITIAIHVATWLQARYGWTLFAPFYVDGVYVTKRFSLGNPWLTDLLSLAFLAIVLAASALSFRWVEVPARRWFYRLARERIDRAPATAQSPIGGAGTAASTGIADS